MFDRYRTLDQALIEAFLLVAGKPPDVFPDLVGLKPFALIK
jgi:hypothetical protein